LEARNTVFARGCSCSRMDVRVRRVVVLGGVLAFTFA